MNDLRTRKEVIDEAERSMLPLSKLDCPYCQGTGRFSFGRDHLRCPKCHGGKTLHAAVRVFSQNRAKEFRLRVSAKQARQTYESVEFQMWMCGPLKSDKRAK